MKTSFAKRFAPDRMRVGVYRDCAIADDEDKQTENCCSETMGN